MIDSMVWGFIATNWQKVCVSDRKVRWLDEPIVNGKKEIEKIEQSNTKIKNKGQLQTANQLNSFQRAMKVGSNELNKISARYSDGGID